MTADTFAALEAHQSVLLATVVLRDDELFHQQAREFILRGVQSTVYRARDLLSVSRADIYRW